MANTAAFQLDWRNILGLVLSVLVAFISGPGGQGGGSFYIPLFSVLLGFSTNDAQALSASVVFFGCITMVAQAIAMTHPQIPKQPVVDYTLVLAMAPSLMLGLALGVLLNAVMSQWLVNLLVIAVWTWSTIQLCFTYRKTSCQEKQQLACKQQQQEQMQHQQHQQQYSKEKLQLQDKGGNLGVTIVTTHCSDRVHITDSGSLWRNEIAQHKHSRIDAVKTWASFQPWWRILFISLLFGCFITLQVIRGAVTTTCSVENWILLGLVIFISSITAVAVSMWLLRHGKANTKTVGGLPLAVGDSLTSKTTATTDGASAQVLSGLQEDQTPALKQQGNVTATASDKNYETQLSVHAAASVSSSRSVLGSAAQFTTLRLAKIHIQMIIAGLLLGAWPLSPIILALPQMHPQVGAASSKLMLFMITGGTGISFLASGRLSISYLLAYGLTNATATPLGVWVMDRVIKRTGRPSYILMLTIVRLAACVVVQLAFQAVPSLIQLARGLPRAGFLPAWCSEPDVDGNGDIALT